MGCPASRRNLADLGYQPLVRHLAVTVDTAPTGGGACSPRHYPPRPARPAARPPNPHRAGRRHPPCAPQPWRCCCGAPGPGPGHPEPTDLLAACVEVSAAGCPGWKPNSPPAGSPSTVAPPSPGWPGRCGPRSTRPPAPRSPAPRWSGRTRSRSPLVTYWDHYRHDSGISVSWALREAPRQAVDATVLAPLVAPGPYPRRVCWLYQPYPAEQAAAKVEAQVTAGQIRRAWAARTRRDETQRDRDDRDRATLPARKPPGPGSAGSPSTPPPPSPTTPNSPPRSPTSNNAPGKP